MFTINCKGKIISTETPLVMGIINATPDSFYKGDLHSDMIELAGKMISEGADILDIGGQSTRPGAELISADEEMKRIIPVIRAVLEKFPGTVISVDTFYSSVATAAVDAGASIINDISGGEADKEMIPLIGAMGNVPYVCMHTKGMPADMQQYAQYENVTREVLDYFIRKSDECKKAGIKDMIIDPGFGFAKNAEHNFILLRELELFRMFEKPLLAGISRKSTIYKTLGITPEEALNGTTTLNTIALLNGADILRVHDVKEAKQAVTLVQHYNLRQ